VVPHWPGEAVLRVSVVVVIAGTPPFLPACLRAIRAGAGGDDSTEVVIGHRGPLDPEVRSLVERCSLGHDVRLVPVPESASEPEPGTRAATAATSQILVFLDPSVEPLGIDSIASLARWASQPGIGAVGPLLLGIEGTVRSCCLTVGPQGR